MAAANLGSPLKSLVRLVLYAGFTLPLMPVQALAVLLDLPLQRTMPLWYHRHCCRLLGFRVEASGRKSTVHPTLYASNHVSYIDIMVLGSLIEGSFVAKAEVASWPLYGWLAKLQRSVFVERRGRKAVAHRDEMSDRLERGDDLILFPEGTSSDGIHVLPFKSSLFSVAERRTGSTSIAVQPVSIAYRSVGGLPMPRYMRPYFAWYGDMELASHLWQVLRLGRVTVVVEFHPTATIDRFASRKALAAHCHGVTAAGMSAGLHGVPADADRPESRSRAA